MEENDFVIWALDAIDALSDHIRYAVHGESVSVTETLKHILFLRNVQDSITIMQEILHEVKEEMEEFTLVLGQIRRKPASLRGRKISIPFTLWCAACHEISDTRDEDLDRCPKCGSPGWRGNYIKDTRRMRGLQRENGETEQPDSPK